MSNSTQSYRNIVKGTAIFGGTQMIVMLLSLIKGKFVALLLGTYGMGINSLINSVLAPVTQFFSMGLSTSSVSSISGVKDDRAELSRVVTAYRRILLVFAFLSVLFMVGSAQWIYDMVFSKEEGIANSFAFMGIAAFFMILMSGNISILQGCRCLTQLSMCNIVGALSGVAVGIPFYYFMGIDGIAPAIIVMAFVSWVYSHWQVNRIRIGKDRQSWRETFNIGRKMVVLGATIMVAALLGNLSIYIINVFIGNHGSISDVGLYQAATSVTTQCTALVFTALATDYFPHLSEVAKDLRRARQLIEQEGEIVLLVCTPLSLLLMLLAPVIVRILLTDEFICIVPVIQMMAVSFMMRAVYFPLDYISVAKGDKNYYFWMEGVWTNVKTIAIFIPFYYYFGFIGIGYASIVNAIVDIIVSFTVVRWRFKVAYFAVYYKLLLPLALLVGVALSVLLITESWVGYATTAVCCAVSLVFSLKELNKRVDLKSLLDKGKNKS